MIKEKYELSLEKARDVLKTAEYMAYITYPVIKENRFLIRILEELNEAMLNMVKAVLHYEYLYKRIQLYSDSESNFEVFEECASRYGITHEQLKNIRHIFSLIEMHKQSPVEFVKKDRFVILSDNLRTDFITIDILKQYLFLAKNIMAKAEQVLAKRMY